MVTFALARNALKSRLDAVFGSEAFADLYPGVQPPKVYQGFPVNEPPFYVAVDEIVDAAASSGAASMGHARIDFTLNVWCFARHASLETAADALLSYVDAVFASVLADQQLCMAVDSAFPRVRDAGTGADGSKRYVAAATVEVACSVCSACHAGIKEVVDAIDGEN